MLTGMDGNHDGGPRRLSYQASQAAFERPVGVINRSWDVDSVIALLHSLAAHRGGFKLSYRPPYTCKISGNQHVAPGGIRLDQTKHLRLGYGVNAQGSGYQCYVFFPKMRTQRRRPLYWVTDSVQRVWIDGIIIPALQRTCSSDVLQHHPSSFDDAYGKSSVKKELNHSGRWAPIDIRFTIPEEHLESFWEQVLELCECPRVPFTNVAPDAFSGPVLVAIAHGLKLQTKRATLSEVQHGFSESFTRCFNPEFVDREGMWVDVGIEDTPIAQRSTDATAQPITLLYKTGCLKEGWAEAFASPSHSSYRTKFTSFPQSGSKEAGNGTLELMSNNTIRGMGGVALCRAYNVTKELFNVPILGLKPFSNPQLEAAGYSEELITRWYQMNHPSAGKGNGVLRRGILNAILSTKRRLRGALHDSRDKQYGVRQEYRVTIDLFERLRGPGQPISVPIARMVQYNDTQEGVQEDMQGEPQERDRQKQHLPYYILPTREVIDFLSADINRWLFLLEVLISRADSSPGGPEPVEQEVQMINGVMVSALLRTLGLITAGDPRLYSSIWKDKSGWKDKGSARQQHRRHHRQRLDGLNLRRISEETGLIWYPDNVIEWEGDPTFLPGVMARLHLARNGLQRGLRVNKDIQVEITAEHIFMRRFRERVQDPEMPLKEKILLAAEIIIHTYTMDIIEELSLRWDADTAPLLTHRHRAHTVKEACQIRKRFTACLDHEGAHGMRGLYPAMIRKLVGSEPYMCSTRSTSTEKATCVTGTSNELGDDAWASKLEGLFTLKPLPDGKRRKWENANFRLAVRRLSEVIAHEIGAEVADQLVSVTAKHATAFLWIIPRYYADKLMVSRTPRSNQSVEIRQTITTNSRLQNINYISPELPHRVAYQFDAIQDHYCGVESLTEDKLHKKVRYIRKNCPPASLKVRTTVSQKGAMIPWPDRHYGIIPRLRRIIEFIEDMREEVVAVIGKDMDDEEEEGGGNSDDEERTDEEVEEDLSWGEEIRQRDIEDVR